MKIVDLKKDMDGRFGELKKDMDGRFGELKNDMDGRFGELKNDMDGRFGELKNDVDGRFGELKTAMDARFAQVDARFDRQEKDINQRFEEVHQKSATEHETTRRYMDVLYEKFKADIQTTIDQGLATNQHLARWIATNANDHVTFGRILDDHEVRLKALEPGVESR